MAQQVITEDKANEQPEISLMLQQIFRTFFMPGVVIEYKTLIALGNFWL